MRVLLLLRGSAGCGKSTFIENNGLKPFALSADDIRFMYSSPQLDVYGNKRINQSNDKLVWDTLFRMLEQRMQNGEFTVIDATNSKTSEMNRYKELANNYRYRIYCIDMTDIPKEEVKRRNTEREELKRVPEEAIDKMYARFESQKIPSGIKVLKPEELDTIWYRPIDLSKYNKIHVIGDIHGCYTALMEYINSNGGIKSDEFYIFLGDYIDRGIENAEVVNWIIEQINCPNMTFLEGNHERWLWLWANDVTGKSKEFEFVTKPQLVDIDKKKVREFYRRLGQVCYFTYHGKTMLATHGGISNIPDNLLKIATEQIIKGVGTYKDSDNVDNAFYNNTSDFTYQFHGHRNVINSTVKTTERTFNLEGQVEFGGCLRAVQITKDGIETFEIKNDVFKPKKVEEETVTESSEKDMTIYSLVESMRTNHYIYEKTFGRISSFNFTKQAFERREWGEIINKARGLYIDTQEYKIVARAYDKFFNIDERPETKLTNLQYKLQFPVTAYVKENGFLGIVGWNPETEDLLITSKSSPISDFSGYLRNALYFYYGNEKMEKIKEFIKDNECSFVFECCDIENDPHIIKYPKTKVVLLDIVKNTIEFDKLSYENLVGVAENIGLEVKKKAYVIDNWSDFFVWYNEVTSEDYKYNDEYIEGFVIEDSVGYMVKLKLHYYKMWKKLRGVAQSVLRSGNYRYTGGLLTPVENEFFGYCKMLFNTLSIEERNLLREKTSTNICYLRDEFYKWKADNKVIQKVVKEYK